MVRLVAVLTVLVFLAGCTRTVRPVVKVPLSRPDTFDCVEKCRQGATKREAYVACLKTCPFATYDPNGRCGDDEGPPVVLCEEARPRHTFSAVRTVVAAVSAALAVVAVLVIGEATH